MSTVINGKEAAAIGLVTRCVPDGQAKTEAMGLAEQLSRGPKVTLQYVKRLVELGEHAGLEETMDRVSEARAAASQAREGVEGMRAYAGKRQPDWLAASRTGV